MNFFLNFVLRMLHKWWKLLLTFLNCIEHNNLHLQVLLKFLHGCHHDGFFPISFSLSPPHKDNSFFINTRILNLNLSPYLPFPSPNLATTTFFSLTLKTLILAHFLFPLPHLTKTIVFSSTLESLTLILAHAFLSLLPTL